MTLYQDNVAGILANAEKYHHAYYQAETFRGPSLYFHQRALQTRNSVGLVIHLEYVYATLASWGMHRMGNGGAKMRPFDAFCQSVEPLMEKIAEAQRFSPQNISPSEWAVLKEVFQGIKVMASGTSLVGNSKVMHHMMPNIVPPIDRNYTLRYLRGNTSISNDVDREWQIMKETISDFFIPVASDAEFASKARECVASQDKYPWDTSVLKVVDNLVIGSMT
jgi:hypothetical protein